VGNPLRFLESVRNVKLLISQKKNIPVEKQRLFHENNLLLDSALLSDYTIDTHCQLRLRVEESEDLSQV